MEKEVTHTEGEKREGEMAYWHNRLAGSTLDKQDIRQRLGDLCVSIKNLDHSP